jgi:hypothetical protein
MAEGGDDSCNTGLQCYNHFTTQYFRVSEVWTRYAFTWAQLAQGWDNTGGAIPRDYQPQKEITGLSFAPVWPDEDPKAPIQGKSFDFSIDDVSFDIAGPFVDTGFKSLVSEATFNGAFPGYDAGAFGNPYQQLATALDDARFSRIAREGSVDDRKREIAAMMAHMKQETGGLTLAEEIQQGLLPGRRRLLSLLRRAGLPRSRSAAAVVELQLRASRRVLRQRFRLEQDAATRQSGRGHREPRQSLEDVDVLLDGVEKPRQELPIPRAALPVLARRLRRYHPRHQRRPGMPQQPRR